MPHLFDNVKGYRSRVDMNVVILRQVIAVSIIMSKYGTLLCSAFVQFRHSTCMAARQLCKIRFAILHPVTQQLHLASPWAEGHGKTRVSIK